MKITGKFTGCLIFQWIWLAHHRLFVCYFQKYQAAARFFTLRDVTSRVLGVDWRNFTRALPELIRIDIIRQNLHSRSPVFRSKESQHFRGVVWDLATIWYRLRIIHEVATNILQHLEDNRGAQRGPRWPRRKKTLFQVVIFFRWLRSVNLLFSATYL